MFHQSYMQMDGDGRERERERDYAGLLPPDPRVHQDQFQGRNRRQLWRAAVPIGAVISLAIIYMITYDHVMPVIYGASTKTKTKVSDNILISKFIFIIVACLISIIITYVSLPKFGQPQARAQARVPTRVDHDIGSRHQPFAPASPLTPQTPLHAKRPGWDVPSVLIGEPDPRFHFERPATIAAAPAVRDLRSTCGPNQANRVAVSVGLWPHGPLVGPDGPLELSPRSAIAALALPQDRSGVLGLGHNPSSGLGVVDPVSPKGDKSLAESVQMRQTQQASDQHISQGTTDFINAAASQGITIRAYGPGDYVDVMNFPEPGGSDSDSEESFGQDGPRAMGDDARGKAEDEAPRKVASKRPREPLAQIHQPEQDDEPMDPRASWLAHKKRAVGPNPDAAAAASSRAGESEQGQDDEAPSSLKKRRRWEQPESDERRQPPARQRTKPVVMYTPPVPYSVAKRK